MKDLKITTSQIAKICNVSQGTVDRALNNRPDIKAETKQKIILHNQHLLIQKLKNILMKLVIILMKY